ncbi:hypothetical protein AgCh_015559 [Apium graveolens]
MDQDKDNEEQNSEGVSKKRTRGPTLCTKLKRRMVNQNLEYSISFDEYGDPIEDMLKDFRSYIGSVARVQVDINIESWDQVDQGLKDAMWDDIKGELQRQVSDGSWTPEGHDDILSRALGKTKHSGLVSVDELATITHEITKKVHKEFEEKMNEMMNSKLEVDDLVAEYQLTPLPVPCDEHETVGNEVCSFVQWSKDLVTLGEEPIFLEKK